MDMEMESEGKDKKYDEYAVKCAADCLMEAEMYKQDPKMMGLVQDMLAKKKKAITSIDGLKSKAAEMDAMDNEDDSEESDD